MSIEQIDPKKYIDEDKAYKLKLATDMLNYLKEIELKKNVLTESEFAEFLPLYQEPKIGNLASSNHTLVELSTKFRDRVCVTRPIVVVYDYDPKKIRCILPKPLNEMVMLRDGNESVVNSLYTNLKDENLNYVKQQAEYNTTMAIVNSQGMTKENIDKLRNNILLMEIEALKRLNPEHPLIRELVKKNNELTSNTTEENKSDILKINFDIDENDI